VLGYTLCNDVSARDAQFAEKQWSRAKSFDTFCPLGPWIVTADEIADPQDLGIRARVNGETVQDSSTREMIFGVAELVSYLSTYLTLEPGDVIATGTPPGVGFARKPPLFLKDGDVVEIEVDGIGVLRNPVVAR
jgi:2-keto-4-pentenoate hydratase/2-oxohepta-3-ene-1,7-dioic acid hydratase in catechol pathway